MQIVDDGPHSSAVSILAMERLRTAGCVMDPPWTATDAEAIRRAGGRQVSSVTHAAQVLSTDADRLVSAVEVEAPLVANGIFGRLWPGHPFASSDFTTSFRLREPDITRGLERLMSPASGADGTRRAITFLTVLADLTGSQALQAALIPGIRPAVSAEYPIRLAAKAGRDANVRIDLLFRWPVDEAGGACVVVVEAKFGAAVTPSQLPPYRREAVRLAKGGPVTCILLTSRPDPAERRNLSWKALRWPTLMRRWERGIMTAGDDDPEFTRLRAHIWRHIRP